MARLSQHYVEFNGKNMSLRNWAREFNMCYHTLLYRYKKGYRDEELFQRSRLSPTDKTKPMEREEDA